MDLSVVRARARAGRGDARGVRRARVRETVASDGCRRCNSIASLYDTHGVPCALATRANAETSCMRCARGGGGGERARVGARDVDEGCSTIDDDGNSSGIRVGVRAPDDVSRCAAYDADCANDFHSNSTDA